MIDRGESATIGVEVVYALPGRCWSTRLTLTATATVAQALALAMSLGLDQLVGQDQLQTAVYGRIVQADVVLREGDRLELLRPLTMDPKQRRRIRASGAQAPKR